MCAAEVLENAGHCGPVLLTMGDKYLENETEILVDGFIRKQIDFLDPSTTVDQILEAADILGSRGTAGFLATITTSPKDVIEDSCNRIIQAIKKQGPTGHILGIHLEGPFISGEYGYRGMPPQNAICPPDLEWFRQLQTVAQGHLRLVTIAPEHQNASDFIRAVAPEVIVSVGHSNCSYPEIRAAVDAGLRLPTHIGNACRQTIDRHNNPIFNILGCPDIALCFIPDGFHLPEAFIRMLVNCRSIEDLIVVSDSMMHAGMEPGQYTNTSGFEVTLREDGRLSSTSDNDVLAGSSFNMMQCMNHLASLDILDEGELLRVGYLNPLSILGLNPNEYGAGRGVRHLPARGQKF